MSIRPRTSFSTSTSIVVRTKTKNIDNRTRCINNDYDSFAKASTSFLGNMVELITTVNYDTKSDLLCRCTNVDVDAQPSTSQERIETEASTSFLDSSSRNKGHYSMNKQRNRSLVIINNKSIGSPLCSNDCGHFGSKEVFQSTSDNYSLQQLNLSSRIRTTLTRFLKHGTFEWHRRRSRARRKHASDEKNINATRIEYSKTFPQKCYTRLIDNRENKRFLFSAKCFITLLISLIFCALSVALMWKLIVLLFHVESTQFDKHYYEVETLLYEQFMRQSEPRFGNARPQEMELWIVNIRDDKMRQRRARRELTLTHYYKVDSPYEQHQQQKRTFIGERNLASECGAHCTIRLTHPSSSRDAKREMIVEFKRWRGAFPPGAPLVQLLDVDANRSTLARPFSAPAACIYTASVHMDVQQKSIVNLCGENGGMFGMLALAELGTFAIEPLLEASGVAGVADNEDVSASRRRQRRAEPISASHDATDLHIAHLVYRISSQNYDTSATSNSLHFPALSELLSTENTKNDFIAFDSPSFMSLSSEKENDIFLNTANDSIITANNNSKFSINRSKNDLNSSFNLSFTSLPNVQLAKIFSKNNSNNNNVDNDNNNFFNERPHIVILNENETLNNAHFRERRIRRSANSWDNYVEVLVVADYRMLLYHQRNLENYVLTLFSTVASIYRHPSLGASINIVVVRLIILKHERAGPQVSTRAQETLQQFCSWQQNYNDPNDDALSHHDVAILLTRHDICRATNKCDTLGLAELGTMCDAQKSCAIIEDNGLSAAFTIAHELGHILNIPHDDERKCGEFMPLNKHNYHIMAPTLEYNTNPWSWSPCSAHMLSKFLDTHRAQTHCILDQPTERRYFDRMFENAPAPGSIYTVNQQCQFVFGNSAEICPYMPTCRRLWCSVSYGYQMGCRTQHMPWADGTSCGDNMWCHSGHCVGMSPRQRQKQDGSWGEWKPWLECSRTCGGGVQKALRDCDAPAPANGGRYCIGQRERYRPCNVQECPWDAPGFRETQCAAFDGKDVGIHGVPIDAKWMPKYTGVSENERCVLYCRQTGSTAFYLLRDKVLDGTLCDQSSDDICIDGICHKAGCDHRLGSDLQRDSCGICGGDDTTCRTVRGAYNERGVFGYNEVVRIPAGAANIDVRQTAHNAANDDDNYLALRDTNGDFLLNGHYQVSVFRQQISLQDAVLEYSGSDHVTERLNGTGPLRADVFLHVLSVGNLNPPNIVYTFTVPIQQQQHQLGRQQQQQHQHGKELAVLDKAQGRTGEEQQQQIEQWRIQHRKQQKNYQRNASSASGDMPMPSNGNFYWRYADGWSECSAKCQGSQTQRVVCVDASPHMQRVVDDRYCASSHAPSEQKRACNLECFNKWTIKSSSTIRQRETICVRVFTNGGEEIAPDEECHTANVAYPTSVSRLPAVSKTHDIGDSHRDRVRWVYSEYSQCSTTCGTSGIAQRNARCVDIATQRDVDSRHCDVTLREPIITECSRVPCPRWTFGHWSECSRSCGGGVRVRHAICQDASGKELNSFSCPASERKDREKCNETPCTQWEFGSWSTCSVTCGRGIQRRDARCIEVSSASQAVSFQSPIAIRYLDAKRCDVRARIIEKECIPTACASWSTGTWSACSMTCGDGFQTRAIACVDANQTRLSERACGHDERPASHQTCNHGPCPQWRIPDWTVCSVSCGSSGVRQRDVACIFRDAIVDDSLCMGHTANNNGPLLHQAPARQEACALLACAQWEPLAWSACSVSCGVGGVQRRVVQCTRSGAKNTIVVYERECDAKIKPRLERICERDPCPVSGEFRWETGEWSDCSALCGGGWRRRSVECVDKLTRTAANSAIQCRDVVAPRPAEFETCNMDECATAKWRTDEWSKCSVTCGTGQQRRRVWCQSEVLASAPALDVAACGETRRPADTRDCQMNACAKNGEEESNEIADSSSLASTEASTESIASSQRAAVVGPYTWRSGQWSACSQSCGRGVRTRPVVCIDSLNGSAQVSAEKCEHLERPAEKHKCRYAQCARWHAGAWSICSTTCGIGVSKRDVYCKLGKRTRVDDLECSEIAKPFETRDCEIKQCPSYHWQVSTWSKCIELCNPSQQHRHLYCINDAGQRASYAMCTKDIRPITQRPCRLSQCPYRWVAGPWSSCSKTCGNGHHFRKIECHVRTGDFVSKSFYFDNNTSTLNETESPLKNLDESNVINDDENSMNKTTPVTNMANSKSSTGSAGTTMIVQSHFCAALEKPILSEPCAINACSALNQWSVGEWSKCSKTCGPGFRHRKVRCLSIENKELVSRELCSENTRPNRREPCFIRNCQPIDCADIKEKSSVGPPVADGNYNVYIGGRRVQVYCHGMKDIGKDGNEIVMPARTFLNVNAETNFAEFYSKRLVYPYSCPYEGRRNDSCACSNDGHVNYGRTRFAKIRIDLHNMKINPNDFTFAVTDYGNQIPYGSAGDCYSMTDCPQGRFLIDMRGSGLKIVDDLQWIGQGYRVTTRIKRSNNGALIDGTCGGYCGECAPDRFKGLVLALDQIQQSSDENKKDNNKSIQGTFEQL